MKEIFAKLKSVDLLKNIPAYALLLSLALGFLSTILVLYYVHMSALASSGGPKVPVVFACRNIPADAVITGDLIEIKNVPSVYLQFGCIKAKEEAFFIGQKTQVAVKKGNALLWSDLKLESLRALEQKLAPGERALTISVTQESGVNGFINPGDRADIFVTYSSLGQSSGGEDTSKTKQVTKLLLQNIVVLAVGSDMEPKISEFENIQSTQAGAINPIDAIADQSKGSTLTLKVTPTQAAMLIFAEQEGAIRFVLRSRQDILTEPLSDVSFDDLSRFVSTKDILANVSREGYPIMFEEGVRQESSFMPQGGFGSKLLAPLPDKIEALKSGKAGELIRISEDTEEKKTQKATGLFNYIIILLVIIVALLAYLKFKKPHKDNLKKSPPADKGCSSCR